MKKDLQQYGELIRKYRQKDIPNKQVFQYSSQEYLPFYTETIKKPQRTQQPYHPQKNPYYKPSASSLQEQGYGIQSFDYPTRVYDDEVENWNTQTGYQKKLTQKGGMMDYKASGTFYNSKQGLIYTFNLDSNNKKKDNFVKTGLTPQKMKRVKQLDTYKQVKDWVNNFTY
jgi:hypothetical protein